MSERAAETPAGARAAETPTGAQVDRPDRAGLMLAAGSVLWLAGMLFSARATITGRTAAEMEVTSTAYALPGVVSASLVAGAAVALTARALTGQGRGASGRLAIATGAGLATGLLAALSIVTINAEGWLYAVLGGTVAAAGTLGGAAAAIRVPRVLAAICWATLAVFVVGLGLNLFQAPLLELLGSGTTRASQANAVNWFALAQSAGSGLVAGLVGHLVLRLQGRRSGPVRWPLHAIAGAGPGIALLVAEALARTAGARVLDLAGRVSDLESAAQELLSGARVNSALIITFVGAITAIIAVGRTLSPAPDDHQDDA